MLAKEAAMTGCISTASNHGGCGHVIQGGKTLSIHDGYIQVTDTEAVETTRLLAMTEGVFGGYSGGANVAAAVKLANGNLSRLFHLYRHLR